MKEIVVTHLVRAGNAIAPLQRFLESYRAHPAGIEHDLLIVFKGFDASQDRLPYEQALATFPHMTFQVSDAGLDITAYLAAARQLAGQYRYFCFLNSFSTILDSGWLKKMYDIIEQPGVGLVGATGAWVSHRSNVFAHFRNPLAYFKSFSGPPAHPPSAAAKPPLWKRIKPILQWLSELPIYIRHFAPYPNYFIRTNAFMVAGDTLNALAFPPVLTKTDAYKFESGKQGLSRKIMSLGKRILVVGRDGKGYEKETWPQSKTLFASEQENLLVADNRTTEYQLGTAQRRSYLSQKAWH